MFFNARQWAPIFEAAAATGKFDTEPQDTLTARGIVWEGVGYVRPLSGVGLGCICGI